MITVTSMTDLICKAKLYITDIVDGYDWSNNKQTALICLGLLALMAILMLVNLALILKMHRERKSLDEYNEYLDTRMLNLDKREAEIIRRDKMIRQYNFACRLNGKENKK